MTDKKDFSVEEQLRIYRNFLGENAQATLDKMPQTQATLDTIEEELDKYIVSIPGKDKKEKWFNLVRGLQYLEQSKK